MNVKDFWEKLTTYEKSRNTENYQTVPVRNFYNSILTADVFEKQKFVTKQK